MSMVAIGADDIVIRPERSDGSHGDRLFTDIEVEKPGDLGKRVHLRRLLFKSADQQHLAIQGTQIVLVHVGHYACHDQTTQPGYAVSATKEVETIERKP